MWIRRQHCSNVLEGKELALSEFITLNKTANRRRGGVAAG